MIVSTSKSDTMLRRAFDKQKTVVISIDKMLDQLMLDPTIEGRSCYVITNEDISAARLKTKFEQAAASKHSAVKILFINKSSRPLYPNGLMGVDAILQKPKPADLQRALSAIISDDPVSLAADAVVAPNITQEIPVFNPMNQTMRNPALGFDESMLGETQDIEPEHEQYQEPEPTQPLPVPEPIPEPAPVQPTPVDTGSELVERISTAGTVKDLSVLVREISASTVIKDMIDSNSTYAGIEEKIKSLNDTIYLILNDNSIKSLDEKLSKIRSIMHDKAFFSSKGDTLLEQRLEEVIDTICDRTSSLIQSRLAEIDDSMKYIDKQRNETNGMRLAGLNEKRANLIVELQTMEYEMLDIFRATDTVTVGVATEIAKNNKEISGNEMIDANIVARGGYIISDESWNAVRAAFELAEQKVPPVFEELRVKIKSLITLMGKMLDLDAEVIAAQQAQVNFFKARNIEDTVVAQSLLKKALRVFIGEEGVGRSIIPYLISAHKSRQSCNVLCIDLTGCGKYSDYGIQYTSLDTFLAEQNQREFMLVSGRVENTVEAAQRITTSLIRAADYYRIINVIVSTDQQELFQTVAQDTLSTNFIVDTNVQRINRMRDIINKCSFENVAQRVIINKCDIAVKPVVEKLGLADRIDFQLVTIPTMPAISDACMNGYSPYGVSAVELIMEEVIRHA